MSTKHFKNTFKDYTLENSTNLIDIEQVNAK